VRSASASPNPNSHPERVMSRPTSAANIRVIGELRAGIARHKEAGQA
jgi:hypothetical protein